MAKRDRNATRWITRDPTQTPPPDRKEAPAYSWTPPTSLTGPRLLYKAPFSYHWTHRAKDETIRDMARKDTSQATRNGEAETRPRPSPSADVRTGPPPSEPSRAGHAGRPARKSSSAAGASRPVCVRLTQGQEVELLRAIREREAITIPHLLA